LTRGGKDIAFADYSPLWKSQRRLVHSAFSLFGEGSSKLQTIGTYTHTPDHHGNTQPHSQIHTHTQHHTHTHTHTHTQTHTQTHTHTHTHTCIPNSHKTPCFMPMLLALTPVCLGTFCVCVVCFVLGGACVFFTAH